MLSKNICKAILITAFGISFTAAVNAREGHAVLHKTPKASLPAVVRCSKNIGGYFLAVTVQGIRFEEGNVRAQIYSDKPEEFLAEGKKLVRLDTKTKLDDRGEQKFCITLPSAGTYALVVMHDRNMNGKADFFTEGFGFSRNPKLGFAAPSHDEVVFTAKPGVDNIYVTLTYIIGADKKQVERRRRSKRR